MKSSQPSDLDKYLEQNDSRILGELFEFLRIPSVSARSEHNGDTARAAEWLKQSLEKVGMTASIHPTPGHPIVIGEWREAKDAPTVLVYGHYDVLPAEGEEEVGSANLEEFVSENQGLLKADVAVISDSSMFAPGQPSILSSLRGLAYFQIDVQGPKCDLHSGSYGGAVINPAMALARILATFHDENGHVAIPGFYDKVHEWEPRIREQMKTLPFDEKEFRSEVGSPDLGGEKGYTILERLWSRPTCEVNGLLSGYTGEGAKTVLPAKAMAKVSCRLVPDQDPAE